VQRRDEAIVSSIGLRTTCVDKANQRCMEHITTYGACEIVRSSTGVAVSRLDARTMAIRGIIEATHEN
jgi:hypothetical protein